MKSVKVTMVGDSEVGKTSLMITRTRDTFPEGPMPLVSDHEMQTLMFENVPTILDIWDSESGGEHDRMRPTNYPCTDLFLLVFSCVSPESFENIRSRWYPEIKKHGPRVPILLVATKTDLLEDAETLDTLQRRVDRGPVTVDEIRDLALEIGAITCFETSAKRGDGVALLFESAPKIVRGTYNGPRVAQTGGSKGESSSKCAIQ